MVKVYREEHWKFRMIVTDLNDFPIEVESRPGTAPSGTCEFSEVMDYPYAELVRRLHGKERGALFHLGAYFSERDSREAEKYFRLGTGADAGYPCKYFLAESLLEAARNDRGTAEYLGASQFQRNVRESETDAHLSPRATSPPE
jgi:hypothetical protein